MKLNTLSLSIMTMGALAGASLTAHASGYHFGTQSVSAQATPMPALLKPPMPPPCFITRLA